MTLDPPRSSPDEGAASYDAERPWLGLASYTEETKALFHGREDEIGELARRAQRKLLTVLFGQSGLGKTSILKAGLVPKLRPEGFCPVYVRLDYSSGGPSLTEQIKQAIIRSTSEAGQWSRPRVAQAGETLWEFLHHRDNILTDPSGRALTPFLIFDQFEEIFTLAQTDDEGRARVRAFLREFSDLVENRAPTAIEDDENAAERFDFARADYRVLLALREDYLAHLERLRDLMPSITQNRVGIARMGAGPALEAVLRPGKGLVSDEVARQIVRFVAGVKDLVTVELEPSLLSLVCRELNEARLAKGQQEISPDLLEGSRDSILGEFYERSLADQPPGVRRFIEDELLTDSGYRESLAEERALKACVEAGAPDALAALVDRRLLRIEERLDVRRVELTHDVLCGVVKSSRETRKEREAKERAERELAATRAEEAATRRAMWRARMVALGAAVLCVFAIGSALFGYRNMVHAREQERVARTIAYSSRMIVARQVLDDSNLGRAKTILENQRPQPGETDLRCWEWRYLWGQTRSDAESILYETDLGQIGSLAVSPDGRLAAIGAHHTGGVVVMDLTTREAVATLAAERQDAQAAFSPTEPLLAFTSANADFSNVQLQLWDTETRELVRAWPLDSACNGLAFSADGGSLLTSIGGVGAVWNVRDGSKIAGSPFETPFWNRATPGTDFAAAADLGLAAYTSRNAFGSTEVTISVRDPRADTVLWTATSEQLFVTAMAFSPDGSILATAEGFGPTDVRIWDVASGEMIGRLQGHESWVGQIVFWPDGSKLATAGADQTIRTWDVASRAVIDVMRGHENEVWRLALLPDNRTLLSGSKDGVVALWDTSKLHPRQARIDLPKPTIGAVWSADGQSLIVRDWQGRIERWSGANLGEVELLVDGLNPDSDGRFSQDGTIYVEQESENSLLVWDVPAGRIKSRIALSLPRAAIDRVMGRRNTVVVYQPGGGGTAQEIELDSSELVQTWSSPNDVSGVATSGDERFTVVMLGGGGFLVNDLEAQTTRKVAADYLEAAEGAFAPDNSLFAVASHLGYVRVWDTATWRELVTLRGFILGANGVAFSPDGKRLATSDGSGKQALRLWDTTSWQEVLTLRTSGFVLGTLNFSPDGNRIGVVNDGLIISVWDAPSWEEIEVATRQKR